MRFYSHAKIIPYQRAKRSITSKMCAKFFEKYFFSGLCNWFQSDNFLSRFFISNYFDDCLTASPKNFPNRSYYVDVSFLSEWISILIVLLPDPVFQVDNEPFSFWMQNNWKYFQIKTNCSAHKKNTPKNFWEHYFFYII